MPKSQRGNPSREPSARQFPPRPPGGAAGEGGGPWSRGSRAPKARTLSALTQPEVFRPAVCCRSRSSRHSPCAPAVPLRPRGSRRRHPTVTWASPWSRRPAARAGGLCSLLSSWLPPEVRSAGVLPGCWGSALAQHGGGGGRRGRGALPSACPVSYLLGPIGRGQQLSAKCPVWAVAHLHVLTAAPAAACPTLPCPERPVQEQLLQYRRGGHGGDSPEFSSGCHGLLTPGASPCPSHLRAPGSHWAWGGGVVRSVSCSVVTLLVEPWGALFHSQMWAPTWSLS